MAAKKMDESAVKKAIADALAERDRKDEARRAEQEKLRAAAEAQREKLAKDARAAALAELEKQAKADAIVSEAQRVENERKHAEEQAAEEQRRYEAIPRWISTGKLATGGLVEISHITQGDLVHVRLAHGVETWAHKDELTYDDASAKPKAAKAKSAHK